MVDDLVTAIKGTFFILHAHAHTYTHIHTDTKNNNNTKPGIVSSETITNALVHKQRYPIQENIVTFKLSKIWGLGYCLKHIITSAY